jgi:acetoin utilization protein AcuB
MKVESIMSRNVIKIKMDETLLRIQNLFEQYKFHHLLVTDEKDLIGVISDRDLLKNLSPFLNTPLEQPRDKALLEKKAHQIMTREPVTINRKTSLEDACRLMQQKNVSCLPVISPEGYIEGVVTWRDLFRTLLRIE